MNSGAPAVMLEGACGQPSAVDRLAIDWRADQRSANNALIAP